MSKRNPWIEKRQFYILYFGMANVFLIISVIFFSIYLIASLFDGKISISALIHYGS
jgi:fumarate reductase subunit C